VSGQAKSSSKSGRWIRTRSADSGARWRDRSGQRAAVRKVSAGPSVSCRRHSGPSTEHAARFLGRPVLFQLDGTWTIVPDSRFPDRSGTRDWIRQPIADSDRLVSSDGRPAPKLALRGLCCARRLNLARVTREKNLGRRFGDRARIFASAPQSTSGRTAGVVCGV